MSELLSAYHAEIRSIEDAWFEEQYESDNRSNMRSVSLWTSDWYRLREIEERHGIHPCDPRVRSIASYRHELGEIEEAWDRDCWERAKIIRADPEADPPYGNQFFRYLNDKANCDARHFPGNNGSNPESAADTLPKAWHFITETLQVLEIHKLTNLGRSILDATSRRDAERTYSLLLQLRVPWALDPSNYPRDFTGGQYRDQLQHFANRLEREEAESLTPELRREFARHSADCARIERIDVAQAPAPKPSLKIKTSASRREPRPEAFAAYRMWKEVGSKQENIAKELSLFLKQPVGQSKVSRWIGQVKRWLGDGNPLPKPQVVAMDPGRLEKGLKRRRKNDED